MLLKVAKTLALIAVAVILLHGLPGVCEETFAIASASSSLSGSKTDDCVTGDSCCASSSFLKAATDHSLGALDTALSISSAHALAPQPIVAVIVDSQEIYSPPPELTKLGKLTI